MLSLSPAVRIFLATKPADMRKSVDGLFGLVQDVLQQDPFTGFLFVFRNRKSDRVKILIWDHGGFWVLYKRLEKGRFHFPEDPGTSVEVDAADLTLLLSGIQLAGARRAPRWSPPTSPTSSARSASASAG